MPLKAVITVFPSVSLPFLAVPLLSQPTVALRCRRRWPAPGGHSRRHWPAAPVAPATTGRLRPMRPAAQWHVLLLLLLLTA
eukprot:SAG22_NODE_1356_length_4631_cov_2.105693_2_plen_81_part_00